MQLDREPFARPKPCKAVSPLRHVALYGNVVGETRRGARGRAECLEYASVCASIRGQKWEATVAESSKSHFGLDVP